MSEQLAFVAGATGYTGLEVVRALRERGVRTVAHLRPDSRALAEWKDRFEALGAEVDTTAWKERDMAATLAALLPTLVFALLGTTRARGRREGAGSSYDTVDYGLTALLLRAADTLEQKPRFVYLSAAAVREGSPGSYLHARWKVERDLEASALSYVVARPSFITGPDRQENRPGERIGAALADGALALAGLFGAQRLRDRYRSTTAAALADALVRLALDPPSDRAIVESEALRSG
jgi:nucleoside-diphosphate-sugar epimerase